MDWGTLGGWIGGLAGGAIGLLGGVFGTYCSIRNTQGPRERAFMIKASVVGWIVIGLFIAGMLLLPESYRVVLWVLYVPLLLWAIHWTNKTQALIRNKESVQQ